MLKAGGGDVLISSISLCAKLVVQNRVKIHFYLYRVVRKDDELRQSSYR